MRNLPVGMKEHLVGGVTTLCWCWKVVRKDGVIMGFSDHDVDLLIDGVIYESDTGLSGTELHETAGLSVDNAEISGVLNSDRITEADISNGVYDSAEIYVYRVNWAETAQALLYKVGSIGEITRSSTYFKAEFRGMPFIMQQPQGRVYQYSCDAEFGDTRCKVDVVPYTFNIIITRIVSSTKFVCRYSGTLPAADKRVNDYLSKGIVNWITGPNAGKKSEVKKHELVTVFTLDAADDFFLTTWYPIFNLPTVGNTAQVIAGCDKRLATCYSKYNNVINYRGFPSIPGTDYLIDYAVKDGNNDGAVKVETGI